MLEWNCHYFTLGWYVLRPVFYVHIYKNTQKLCVQVFENRDSYFAVRTHKLGKVTTMIPHCFAGKIRQVADFQNPICRCTLRRSKTFLYKLQSLVLINFLKDLVPQYIIFTLTHEIHLISQPFPIWTYWAWHLWSARSPTIGSQTMLTTISFGVFKCRMSLASHPFLSALSK